MGSNDAHHVFLEKHASHYEPILLFLFCYYHELIWLNFLKKNKLNFVAMILVSTSSSLTAQPTFSPRSKFVNIKQTKIK